MPRRAAAAAFADDDDDAEPHAKRSSGSDSEHSDDESFSADELGMSSADESSDYASASSSDDDDDDAPARSKQPRVPRSGPKRALFDTLAAGNPDDELVAAADAARDAAWSSAGVLSLATLGGEIRRGRLAKECGGQCVLCKNPADGGCVIMGAPWALLVCSACNPDRAACYAQLMSLARDVAQRWQTDFARLWDQREALLAAAARFQK
jgi:hypothetical protein